MQTVETEEEMRQRLLEEVTRTFRLERVRRLQEEREEEERVTCWQEQQERDLRMREEDEMTYERRSPSTATESAFSASAGFRRRDRHPLQRELWQLREEVEHGGDHRAENARDRQRGMVELYHVTTFDHWTGIAGDFCGAAAQGVRAMLPCPNCWLGMHHQRGRSAVAWKGTDGLLHSVINCVPLHEHSTTIRGMPLCPCRFCMNGITSDPSIR